MRVLVIHTCYQLKGGEDSVVANEIELLRSKGLEVELLSFKNSGYSFAKLLQMPFNYSSYFGTKRKINVFKPDVVHIHNLHFAGSASVILAVNSCKVPMVCTLHNYRLLCPSATLFYKGRIFPDSLNSAFPWSAVKNGVYLHSRLITLWVAFSMYLHEKLGVYKAVDRFIVLGEHSKQLFSSSRFKPFASRIIVKPNFCFPDKHTGLERAASYYLYVGRLTEEKGITSVLEAFSGNGLPLKIIGEGPMEKLVENYCSRFPNIIYPGRRSKTQVYQAMANAKALIFPSLWYETFGMVIIEAFSMGVPVIASDLGNMKNMVQDHYNGLRFAPGNTVDLQAKVEAFEILSASEKETYCQHARETYNRIYAPDKNADQLTNIYMSVI